MSGGQGVSDGFDADASEYTGLERAAEIERNLAEADDLDETLQRVVDLAMGYIDTAMARP